jgi:hypothetical protein
MHGVMVLIAKLLYMVLALAGGPPPPVEADTVVEAPVVEAPAEDPVVEELVVIEAPAPEVIQGETVETNSDYYHCQRFPSDCVDGRWIPAPIDGREVICEAMGPGVQSARSIADVDAHIASGACVVV